MPCLLTLCCGGGTMSRSLRAAIRRHEHRSSLPFLARCATRIIRLTPPPRRSFTLPRSTTAPQSSTLSISTPGPLAFPFARSSPVPTLTTAYGRLDWVESRRAFEAFSEQPLVATSWAQRVAVPAGDWRATIHGAVDLRQFRFRADPGDNLVYVGRVGPEKRLDWAIDLTGEVDRRLVIAGWVAPEDHAYFDDVLAPRIARA